LGELIGGIPATIGSAATMSSTGFVRLSPDLIGIPPERDARAQEVAPEFVESVRTHGILQPILVRRRTKGYEVIVGARRLVAARLAGLKEIPAVVIQATDEEGRELSNVENTWWGDGRPVIPQADPVVPAEEVAPARCWTPVRIAMMCGGAILLGLLGAGAGLWFGKGQDPEPVRGLAAVDDGSAGTPRPTEIKEISQVQPVPELDGAEFSALASEGLSFIMGSNGEACVVFDTSLFSSRAVLAGAAAGLLNKVGEILVRHAGEWDVVVMGHTDAVPLRGNGLYRDNKELGLARAVEGVRYLIREAGVPAAMLYAATAGEVDPPYPGDDPESRMKNRTVTLKIRLRQ
jgi:outer membrane protein OmpA-like peptidoglycan-associated protein